MARARMDTKTCTLMIACDGERVVGKGDVCFRCREKQIKRERDAKKMERLLARHPEVRI